jgi:hypothetical protein
LSTSANPSAAGRVHKGVLDEHAIVLEEDASILNGSDAQVSSMASEPGSPATILAAMKSPPHLSEEDVAELERATEVGRRPLARLEPLAAIASEGGR